MVWIFGAYRIEAKTAEEAANILNEKCGYSNIKSSDIHFIPDDEYLWRSLISNGLSYK